MPAFSKKILANGIKTIFAENNELPIINLRVKLAGGQIAETGMPGKYGIAAFTTAMLSEDTKKYTAEQMAVELQKLGSNIFVSSSFDGTIFNVQCLKKNLGKTMELLEERILNPKFTEANFTRIQKQTLEGLKRAKSQPSFIADVLFDKINYPNNIIGESASGSEKSVKNITLKDVEDFYNRNLTSYYANVVVVGNTTEIEALTGLSFLNKLPNKKIIFTKPALAILPTKTTLYLIDVPKAAQTEFRVGFATNKTYDATGEYYKMGLLNFPLGGDFNSRVNLNLREDKAWTYGARTSFSSNEYSGDFSFASGIKANATDSALVQVIKELKNYAEKGITADELLFVKMSIGQKDALAYETGSQKANFIGNILENNLPNNFVNTQSNILKTITKTEIDALAKKWIDVAKMNIVLVGDKALILPSLQKMGYEIIELDVDGNKK